MSLKSLATWMANSLVGVNTRTCGQNVQSHTNALRGHLKLKPWLTHDPMNVSACVCLPLEHGLWQCSQSPSGASLLKGWQRRKSFLSLFWLGQSRPRHHTHDWTSLTECQTGKWLLELWNSRNRVDGARGQGRKWDSKTGRNNKQRVVN